MSIELLVLRLVHVCGGIFWAGGGIYAALFITPALAKAGPAAGPILAEMQRRKLFTVLPLVAVATMLSGIRLMWIVSGGFSAHYFHTRMGHTYAAAGLASIVAFLVALAIARPAGLKAAGLAAQLPGMSEEDAARTRAQLGKLQRRAGLASASAIWLLAFAAVGMSVARYL
ncbi:MAG: hypothetical protein KF689_05705 [Gemmatimonadaceae bacterium]|nr:hypothetical protein [Gemmatimonadaceae bacterium]MCW5825333.1 hypothetical protein [Gemmatimonadaceae bacterium]